MAQSMSKSKKSLLTGIKQLVRYADKNKRGFLLIWNDDTGVRHFGTPAMVEKFENSNKCLGCSENKWDDSAKSDPIAKQEYKFEFDNNATTEDIVKVVYKNDNRIPLLPCFLA